MTTPAQKLRGLASRIRMGTPLPGLGGPDRGTRTGPRQAPPVDLAEYARGDRGGTQADLFQLPAPAGVLHEAVGHAQADDARPGAGELGGAFQVAPP
jgi:hypothetical protein